jgi:hypothetical protein
MNRGKKPFLPLAAVGLLPLLSAPALSAQAAPAASTFDASAECPPYTPVSTRSFSPTGLLELEARWIRAQVWTSGNIGDASAYLFPRSFDVTSGYGILGTDYFSWMLDNNAEYRAFDQAHDDHRLDVPAGNGNDAAIERVMMAGGCNSYDMACWSIALSAAARNGNFSAAEADDFTNALVAYHHFLVTSSYPGGFTSYRVSGTGTWHYGESGVDAAAGSDAQGRPCDARNAYYWAFPAPRWQNPDPHWDPLAPPGAVMNWPGWDGISGEEAWVAFLAPMQVAFNQGRGRPGWSAQRAPVDALALVANACRSLRAVGLMQNSATGGIYRKVRTPTQPDDPGGFSVSLENNWSMYTGLRFLKAAITDLRAAMPGYQQQLDFDLDQAEQDLDRIQAGIRKFFRNRALVWHAPGDPFGDPAAVPYGFFLQGTTGAAGAAQGNTGAFATDVQTWGIAAILGDRDLERELEQVYGQDFLDRMFQAAVELGGYYMPDTAGHSSLAGIGFNAQKAGDPAGQMSGEWTWGAINAAIVLADFHREPARADPAGAAALLAQARSMIAGVDQYCSHYYNPGRRPDGREWVGYLYANVRRWIPWGWYSNPCPSQAATTWALRVGAGFDSFELGGGSHQATVQALGLAGGQE